MMMNDCEFEGSLWEPINKLVSTSLGEYEGIDDPSITDKELLNRIRCLKGRLEQYVNTTNFTLSYSYVETLREIINMYHDDSPLEKKDIVQLRNHIDGYYTE